MDPNQPASPEQQSPQPQPGFTPPTPPLPQASGQIVGTPAVPTTQQPPAPDYSSGYPTNTPQPTPAPVNPFYASHDQVPPMSGGGKKKLFVIVAVVAVLVIGAAAFFLQGGAKQIVGKLTGVELETYTSKDFGFTIQAPKGWAPKEENEEYAKFVSFTEPVGDIKDQSEANKHYANIRISYEFADEDYMERSEQEYFDGIKKGLQRAIEAQEEDKEDNSESKSDSDYASPEVSIESEKMTTVSGLKAYKVKVKTINYEGDKGSKGYEYGLFVFVDPKNQYEISVSAHESESTVLGVVDSILDSFAKK